MIRALSPLSLILICWGGTGLAAFWTLAQLDDLMLVQAFLHREGLGLQAFTGFAALWLIAGALAYAVGDLAAGRPKTRPREDLPLARAARLTFLANLVLLGVTLLWIALAAAQKGGLIGLAIAAYADSLSTREILLESKLFTGMRLFYATLPATGCLAAAILVAGPVPRRVRRLCQITLALNTVALCLLPVVMSQRLLLLQLLLSAYIAACLVRGRLIGLPWLALATVLFAGLWVGREAITNPAFDEPATTIAVQKLAFYIVNDMWNAMAPLGQPIAHTRGALSFEGLAFLTFTDGALQEMAETRLAALDPVLGGGEFPLFTTAYVDFGFLGGALLLACLGFVFRRIFHRARSSVGWAAIYGQIGAALMFSSHSVYVTHQNFLVSLLLIAALCRLARRGPRQPEPLPVPVFKTCRHPQPLQPDLPDAVWRQVIPFTTRRTAQPVPVPDAHEAA